ncbi:MAG: hypothetical protein QG596_1320 [Actinomycetota bacterium]|nr:hypothetical protein [Actinomycetota bacterium]
MAEEPERNMLFDLRGRRKRVIQVIYVILAIIMAASLVVIGLPGGVNPFNSGNGSINQDAAEANVERANDLQQRLQTQPNNENVAKELVRARFSAGQSLYSIDSETGQTAITDEATTQLELAAEAWTKYVKMSDGQPDPEVAQLMAGVFFTLSQGSTVAQFQNNIRDAAKAQQIVADQAVKDEKNGGASASNQLSQLAIYQYYAQDTAAAEKTRQQALASANSKTEKQQITRTLNATEKDAERVGKLINRAIKQAQKDGGKSLQNPLGGLGSDTSVGGTTTP